MVKSFCKKIGAKQLNEFLGLEKGGEFILPPLSYEYNALEPHIDEETLKIHHDKHHAKYVEELNKALKKGDAGKIAFNGSGHVLHSLYWKCLTPGGDKEAAEGLKICIAIDEAFDGFDTFRKRFLEAAKSIQGSGWAALVVEPTTKKLMISQIEKHQNMMVAGASPIMTIDVWEHAYYLKYKNERDKYVEAVFDNLINWQVVDKIYRALI